MAFLSSQSHQIKMVHCHCLVALSACDGSSALVITFVLVVNNTFPKLNKSQHHFNGIGLRTTKTDPFWCLSFHSSSTCGERYVVVWPCDSLSRYMDGHRIIDFQELQQLSSVNIWNCCEAVHCSSPPPLVDNKYSLSPPLERRFTFYRLQVYLMNPSCKLSVSLQ